VQGPFFDRSSQKGGSVHYFPLALPLFMVLVFLFLFLVFLVEIGILRYAYQRIGIGGRHIFSLLLLSLLGSYVNIPVYQLPPEQISTAGYAVFYGVRYFIPRVVDWPGTVVAVNLGGAVVPAVLSVYLIIKNKLYTQSLLAVGLVTVVVHWVAHPVKGIGIAEPIFIPPATAVVAALLLSRKFAPALAYISGSLGTLIGADLLNLNQIQGLGAPVASIGGAGTFDGIFLTGILAVLLAGLMTSPRQST
jgi:uncharacterized membrane protein